MLPLGYKSLAEHDMKVLRRAWEGHLFIRNQRVCHLVLQSPFQTSLPAQLPAKLEFKYIVRISELRKKLPEAAFKKNSYSNDEVCCQQLSFRLYQVEILDESELKDQLIGSMKEKNLALVKYVNDRGILLFLTSSVLAKGKDSEPNDLTSLQALFLFPSPGPKYLTAIDWKCEEGRPGTPQQLPLVLPLLHQALAEAAQTPNIKLSPPSNALLKLHVEKFAKLNRNSGLSRGNTAGPPFISKLSSEAPKGDPVDDKCSPASFSKLAFYLSDPESYTLEVSSALACLQGDSRPPDSCADLNVDPSLSDGLDKSTGTGEVSITGHGPSRAGTPKSSPAGERSLPWTKRKSSRILGASSKKKWSPLKMYCLLENSRKKTKEKEKRKKMKKKKKAAKSLPKETGPLSIPLAKDLGSPADPKKPTLKLKNIQNPLRRKRGAEVLSAEFIQGPRSVSPEGATEASGGLVAGEKKPRLIEAEKAMRNVDKMDTKRPTLRKNVHGVSSEKQRIEAVSVKNDLAVLDALRTSEDCNSHALNMLADLALSSCNVPLDGNGRRDFGRFHLSREHRLPRGKFLHKSSDHEYHRATKKWKGTFLSGKISRSSLWPVKETGRDKDCPSNIKDRIAVNPNKKKKARTNFTNSPLALPNEFGDLSDSGVMISLEHSYASPISENPQKGAPPSPDPRNGVKQDKPGPLVGKVLPFQHQQNSCHLGKPVTNHLSPARFTLMAGRLREDFSTSRRVTSCEKTVQVTFQWEAKYLFNLDSKYTNNSLEKTVLRAVHGPWDESLSDNMEDMRLILHMWMALFYSKKFQALTVRKVVEHSNPAKYVSLNSLVDPLETMDGGGGGGGGGASILEKGQASVSEALQVPAEGGEDGATSLSQKLLACHKLSSTKSLEEESPLTKLEETKDLLEEEEERSRPSLKSVEEAVEADPKEQTLLHPVLPIANPPGVDERVNPPTCQPKADRRAETKLVGASQNDALVCTGPAGSSRNQRPMASTEVALSTANGRLDVMSASEDGMDGLLPDGSPKLRTSKAVEFEADVTSREPPSPGSKVGNQPRLHTDWEEGESMDLGSTDPMLSERNDANMEVQDMDLVSEDEEDPEENEVKGRKETDGMWDETLSRHDLLPSKASPDTLSGHRTEFLTVQEAAVGPSSSSVSPNQTGLIEMVPQQASSLHSMTVEEKLAGSAKKMDPTSPRQIDKVEDSHDEVILVDPVPIQASGDFPNDLALAKDGPLQSQQESVESPRVPNPVDLVDLSSASQEDNRIPLSCLPSWQASPVHQRASDEEAPRGQEDHQENPLYRIFQGAMDLIEDISQDSTELADPAVPVGEPNSDLCLNSVPNSISTPQEVVENRESPVAFAQCLSLAKEMDLVDDPEGEDHPASPLQPDEAAKWQEDSSAKLDLLEKSPVPQEEDVVQPMDNVLERVSDPQHVEFDFGTQEEQTVSRGEKILANSQPAKESLCSELHDVEPETSFRDGTCLGQEDIGDSCVREEDASEDEVEKATVTTAAEAEVVHALMKELVAAVCAMVAECEKTRAQKSLGWINLDMLECVTPPESDDEGSSVVQHSHADVKGAEECLEQSSTFADQKEDLQGRDQGERCCSSKENTTSDPGDGSEKEELQENGATSAARGIFSSCGLSQEELGTTNPKGRWLWLKTTDSLDEYSMSILEEVKQTKVNSEEPICNRDDRSRGEDVENPPFVPAEGQEDSLAEEPDPLVDRDSKQAPDDQKEAQVEAKESLGSLEDPQLDERTQMTISFSSMDVDWEDESLTVESGQDPCVGWHPTSKLKSLDQPRFKASPSIESEFTCSSGPGKETCKDGDWASSEASQKASDAGLMKHNFPFGFKKKDWSLLLSLDVGHKPEHFKDYINFSVTKKHKEKTRTFHTFSKEHSPFSRDLGLINAWSRNWGFLSNPIQNILDLESVRFHCRIREILKRSQRSTSRVLPTKKVPPQGIGAVLPSRTVSEGTITRFPVRSRSPLLVTVVNSNLGTGGRREDFYGPFPATQDPFGPSVAPRSQSGLSPKHPFPSLHLQELTYHKLNSFSRDVSSVVEEFAEFSRATAFDSMRTCNPERNPTATSGEAGEKQYLPRPPRTLAYEDLLAALRNTLHFQLKNVAQETCRKPFLFYVMETEDDPFFGRLKSLLKKGGHTEVDLRQLRQGSAVEAGSLLVIVRNEDIFLHIHKIPSLLHLKHCPNVTFAGVDSPEDALDHTYQELFHSGGFVVSDDNVLQGMSVGELKDVIKTLEKLNTHGRWKWLLHYQESKKLKEDARGDPAAYTKESVLKSCQVANLTEVLHYHMCDSRSCTRFERLNCLLNLQIQHITRRFAVFLTENASACREALEDKGILRLDIPGFIAAAQEMVAPFGGGFW